MEVLSSQDGLDYNKREIDQVKQNLSMKKHALEVRQSFHVPSKDLGIFFLFMTVFLHLRNSKHLLYGLEER